jgi:hypothetical protein
MTESRLPTLGDAERSGENLAIHCLDCRRAVVLTPAALALRAGEDFPVVDLYRRRRLKCTACGSRNATIRVSLRNPPLASGNAMATSHLLWRDR